MQMQLMGHGMPADVRRFLSTNYTGPSGPWMEHFCQDERLSPDVARELLSGFELIPFNDPVRGHMATLIKRNKEVHFAIYRKFRNRAQVSSKRIREFLQPILDKEFFLVTKLDTLDDDRFITHLGFELLGSTIAGIRTYILNQIKYPGLRNANK